MQKPTHTEAKKCIFYNCLYTLNVKYKLIFFVKKIMSIKSIVYQLKIFNLHKYRGHRINLR